MAGSFEEIAWADPEGGGYLVAGKSATSYEYNIAYGLYVSRLEFLFQVSYWGGRNFRGGLVLDFLVYTAPLPTPVWVNGGYWHGQKREKQDAMQQQRLWIELAGIVNRPVIFWDDDCNTLDAAVSAVRRELK